MKYMIAGLIALVGLSGCTTTKTLRIQGCPDCTNAKEGNIRGGPYAAAEALESVYFDFDEANLRKEATGTLSENYGLLESNPQSEILVEGNCDERGTTEYNLGLGQKRANAIRDYYLSLGLDPSRAATISYGKEKPVCSEKAESCYQKNRRGDTKVR